MPLANDIAPLPGSEVAKLRADGTSAALAPLTGNGFTLLDSEYANRGSYTLRLVANGQNVEAMRAVAQAAAADVASASGVSITVAPGTVPETSPNDREPVAGELLLSVDDTTPCGPGMAGCGGPRVISTRASDGKYLVDGGRMWIYSVVLGYTAAQQRHVVAHELGHALGLGHYDPAFTDGDQVMHSSSYSAVSYRAGDRNGFAYLAAPKNQAQVAFVDASRRNAITTWTYNSTAGWHQTLPLGIQVASGTSPSAVTIDGTPHLFYVDAANGDTVSQVAWNPLVGWQRTPLYGHTVAAGTSPSAIVHNGRPHVFFVDASNGNTITDWNLTASGWQQTPLWASAAAAGTSPSAATDGTTMYVSFVDAGARNRLAVWRWSPGSLTLTALGGNAVATGTSPSTITYGGTPHVFFSDATNGNTISDFSWSSGSGWQQTSLWASAAAAGTSPSAATDGTTMYVSFVDAGARNRLAVWRWSPGSLTLTALGGNPAAGGSSPSTVLHGGTPHVFFVDATNGNTISDVSWQSGAWQHIPFFGAPVTAGTSPDGT